MQAVPAIIALAGTAASMSAANRQEKERRQILNRQLEREDQATDRSTALVNDEAQRYSMQNRQQGLQEAERKTYDQTQSDLQGAGGASISAAADNANVSDDFLKTKAARAIDESTRLSAVAREAAKARAPGMLGLDDSLSMASMAGDMGSLWGSTKNMNRASGLQAEAVNEPAYGGLGRIATAVGGAMASSGYGQQRGVPPPPNPNVRSGIQWGAR